MPIADRYKEILNKLQPKVSLVAVSKTHPAETILEVYNAGQRIFAENKVQELLQKQPNLPQDIGWHLIGHLQTNKVKLIAPFIDTIQSVDSEKLLLEIDRQATKAAREIKVLLQIKIAEEDTKSGLAPEEAERLFNKYYGNLENVKITGLMGMATFTEDEQQIKREFSSLKLLYDRLAEKYPLETLSMGMSGDYEMAISCGSNSVRIGSAIFGSRHYS